MGSCRYPGFESFQTSGVLQPNNGAVSGTVAYVNNNYIIANGSNVQPINKWSIKGDHIFNERHRISGYYGYDRESVVPGPDGPATLPGLYSNYNDLRQSTDVVRFSWDWTLSPTKFNHFYAGGNNWRQDHKPPQEYIGNWQDKFCLGNVPDCNDNLANLFSGGSGNTYTTWGGTANNGSENTIYSYNDDFTWVRNTHTVKIGGMLQINHYNGFGRQCEAGCVGFSYTETGKPGVTDPTQGGNAFASFLLGYADSGSIDTPRFIGQQFPYFAGYVQDDWRVNNKLVLNLGVRWETNLPPTGLDDRWSDFSPNRPNPGAGGRLGAVIFADSGPGREGSRTLADSYFYALGPHVGFAYSATENFVIRGSYAGCRLRLRPAIFCRYTAQLMDAVFRSSVRTPDGSRTGAVVSTRALIPSSFPIARESVLAPDRFRIRGISTIRNWAIWASETPRASIPKFASSPT